MTEHEHWDELAAGYALHGLAPDEEVLFEAHLEDCETCAASMSDHEMVAAQLGSIAHYRETESDAPSWESMRSLVLGDREETNVVDLTARRRRYEVSRRVLGAAAAVVVVAGGGVATWHLVSGGGGSCSASKDCHVVRLDAARGGVLASLTVRGNAVSVTPTNMPAAPAGETYVLWQQSRDAAAKPIGEFTSGTGTTAATNGLAAPYSDTQQFAISLEKTTVVPPSQPSNLLASGLAS